DNSAVDKQIQEALAAPYPDRHLPISLTLNYLQTPDKGLRLSASMQVPAEFLTFAPENGQHQAVLTVMGAFFGRARSTRRDIQRKDKCDGRCGGSRQRLQTGSVLHLSGHGSSRSIPGQSRG